MFCPTALLLSTYCCWLLAAASPPSAGRARRSASGEAGNIISRSVGGSGSRIEDNNNNKTASLIFHKRINKIKLKENAITLCVLCVSGEVRSYQESVGLRNSINSNIYL